MPIAYISPKGTSHNNNRPTSGQLYVAIGTDSHGSREESGKQVVGVMPHTHEAVMSTPLQPSAPGGKHGGLDDWPGVEDRTCFTLVSDPPQGLPAEGRAADRREVPARI